MTLQRQLLTSKGRIIDIVSDRSNTISHWANSSSCADIVLNQINQDRLYDPIFENEESLTILDIGGNVGLFSLYAQDRAKVIYSVEPTPDHFTILEELTANYPNIKRLPYALHNEDTTVDFYIHDGNTTMNSTVNKYGRKIEVPTRTLASLFAELGLDHVDFIKCDIEGSEMAAITDETVGAVADKVDCWFVEVHATDSTVPWEQSLEANRAHIAAIFRRQGYQVQNYRVDGLYVYKE